MKNSSRFVIPGNAATYRCNIYYFNRIDFLVEFNKVNVGCEMLSFSLRHKSVDDDDDELSTLEI